MNRRLRLSAIAVLTLALTGAIAPAAHADPPTRTVETLPIVETDPPSFDCGDRVLEFTSGDVTFTEVLLPSGGFLFTIQLSDVEASDGETTYRVRGLGIGQGNDERGTFTFQLNLTFIGDGDRLETVRSTDTSRGDEFTTRDRGSCSVDFG